MRKMKDSGIVWIGEIPSDWMMTKVKFVADFYNGDRGKNYPSGDDLVDDGIVFLTSNNIHSTVLDTNPEITKYITPERYKLLGGAKIKKGDLVFCLRGSIGLCSINESEDEGTVASSLTVLRPKNINNHFLNFILNSKIAEIQTKKFENGSCAANLSAENVGTYIIPYPPLVEQQRIADFLDEKCGEIDSIRSDVQREIEILTDYKKSVITEAVTKGLNSKAKLKDSGIEWIGKIPEGWNVKKLKYVTKIRTEKAHFSPDKDLYIGLENIVSWSNKLIETETEYIAAQYDVCKKGDVLFSKLRPYLAKAVISPKDAFCTGELLNFKFFDGEKKFLWYYLLLEQFVEIVNASTYGAKMPRANADFIINQPIILPPLSEQKAIASYLDEKCSEIDAIIAEKQKQLETLEDYKKSLIFEYVTGKKEVPA